MAYNKFIKKDGTVMLDLTDTTVSAETLAKDIIAVDKSGNKIVGTLTDSPIPIEVSTEEEMTALLETGELGSVYKYVGESGTYENGAFYVLEERDALQGTWVFNDTLDFGDLPSGTYSIYCDFECDGISYSNFYIMTQKRIMAYKSDVVTSYAVSMGSWQDEKFKTITINSVLTDISFSDSSVTQDMFLAFIQTNAIRQ